MPYTCVPDSSILLSRESVLDFLPSSHAFHSDTFDLFRHFFYRNPPFSTSLPTDGRFFPFLYPDTLFYHTFDVATAYCVSSLAVRCGVTGAGDPFCAGFSHLHVTFWRGERNQFPLTQPGISFQFRRRGGWQRSVYAFPLGLAHPQRQFGPYHL